MKYYILILIFTAFCAIGTAQPSNDNPCFATPLTVTGGTLLDEACTTGTMYNHSGATVSAFSTTGSSCFLGQPDVWFSVIVPSTGNIMLNTSEPSNNIDLTMNVYRATLCSGTFTQVACNDDGGDGTIGFQNPIIRLTGRTPGEILFIRIRTYPAGQTNFNFRLCAKNLGTNTPPPIVDGRNVGIGTQTPESHLDVNGDAIVRRDFYVGRNANFIGNSTFNGNLTFNKGLTVNKDASFKGKLVVEDSLRTQGFTKLGNDAPKIKMKKYTGKSSNSQSGFTDVLHSLNRSKIIGVQVIMKLPDFVDLGPGSIGVNAGYVYEFQILNSVIRIANAPGQSANILNKDFVVLVTYEE